MNLNMFENFNTRRISFKEAKRILNRNGNAYADEEVKKIVDYLYALAELEVDKRGKPEQKERISFWTEMTVS